MDGFLRVVDAFSIALLTAPLMLLPAELLKLRRAGRLDRRAWFELGANVSPLIPTALTAGASLAFIAWLFTTASAFSPWRIPVNGLSFAAAVILADFLYYWDHRAGHRIRLLWAISHSVHHSSPVFNQTTAFRISFVDGFISPWFYVPLALAGFHPLMIVSAFGMVIAYQQWIHTETIGKLGWFDAVFNSPSNHRVHHATQEGYLDRNYGGILIIWDRLFGTYAREEEPPVYGLTHPINSCNPLHVHLAEAQRFFQGIRKLKGWRRKLAFSFSGPERTAFD